MGSKAPSGTEGKTIKDLIFGFDDRFEKLAQEIKANVKLTGKILDVGCGEGKIWELFPGFDVTGLDISARNLAKAQKYLVPVRGKAEQLPFKDSSFDLVVASEIFEHLLKPEKTLEEIDRVLKVGGRAIITFPNVSGLQMRLSLLFWGRNPALNYPANVQHLRFFNFGDLNQMLERTNLKVKKTRGVSFLAFHKENFGFYLPVPRKIRIIGGDLFPQLSFGNLVVLRREGLNEPLLEYWNSPEYIRSAQKLPLDFEKNIGLFRLKNLAPKAKIVLDCGCGDGSTIEAIWHEDANFYGVDLSKKAIDVGKKRLKDKRNVHLQVGNIEKLDFVDKQFDLVFSVYTMEHLENPERVVRQMIRVTREKGRLVFIAPNYGSPLSFSPSSPPEGQTLVTRAMKQFIKSHWYLLKRPKGLDWPKVEPLCWKKKKWQPDWDTTSEPYLQTLIYFLKGHGVEIVEYKTHLIKGKEKEAVPPNLKQQLLRLAKKPVEFLERSNIAPYRYFGPDFLVIGRKK